MRSLLHFGLALLQASAITAVTVPEGLAEGTYLIPFDPLTREALTAPILVRDGADTNLPIAARQNQRQNPPSLPQSQVRCAGNQQINVNDFSLAKGYLQSECDRAESYPPYTAIVHIQQTGMAYFCTYSVTARCWRQEVDEAMQRIVNSCGTGRGGEVFIPSYNKAYGGRNAGGAICQ